MFKQITKVDTSNKNALGIAIISLCAIMSVSQQPKHFTRLYDEDGNVVKETLDEPFFEILTNEGLSFVVKEGQYESLKKDLTDFTEITKVNHKGEEGKALINLESVKAIVEQPKVEEKDEDGNAKLDKDGKPIYKPTQFAILRRDSKTFYVYEDEMKRLAKLLNK